MPGDRLKHDANGVFDELVLRGGMAHLERMDDDSVCLMLEKDGKTGLLNLFAVDGKIVVRVEDWDFTSDTPPAHDTTWEDDDA